MIDNVENSKGGGRRKSLPIVVLILGAAFVLAFFAFLRPTHDFMEYWTAAHLVLKGQNPYSLGAMFQAQKSLGWTDPVPLMFVCPPWALTFVAPLGLVSSYSLGWLVWIAMLAAAVAISSRLLMDIYFGDVRLPEISDTVFYRSLFAFTFYPVLLCLKFAQTAPLILLGVAGFLYFERRGHPVLAGVLLSLASIKPQLVFLVWITLALRSIDQRRWRTLVSLASVVGLCTGVALLLDPHAFSQYSQLTSGPYLAINPSGITAMIRRSLNHGDITRSYWMQFIPPLFGVAWLAFYWRKHREHWDWAERMPALITACVLTTAYGWVFDQTVLAVPVIAIAARYARREGHLPSNLVITYTALNCGLMLLMAVPPLTFIPAPVLLLIMLVRQRGPSPVAEIVRA